MSRKNFGQYIHDKLVEPDGQQFVLGKWRFWFVAVAGLSTLNAILTALVFENDEKQWNYTGAIMLSVGALLAWIAVGCLHYSDSTDRRLAQGVSALDSITLLFVAAHFCGLLWVYGHLRTLQSAERKYLEAAEKYNVDARQIQADNAKIADSLRQVAEADKQRARIENDTAYQIRKAAQSGVKITPRQSKAASSSLSTSPVELAKPPEAPKDSPTDYLTRWDSSIRLANFGELLLAVLTLIFIRNRSAKTNSPVEIVRQIAPDFSARAYRSPLPTPAFDSAKNDDTVSLKRDDTDAQQKTTRVVNQEGLKRLREALSQIAFQVGKTHFKADPKPKTAAVWIRQYRSIHGVPREVAGAKAKLSILDDAMRMDRDKFRAKLERFLRENGFQI